MMDNERWIANLKPGDNVAVKKYHIGELIYSIGTVKRVTAAGRIRLDNGGLFDKFGQGKHELGHSIDIVPITDEIREAVENGI